MAAYAYDPNAQAQFAAPAPAPAAAYAPPTGKAYTTHSTGCANLTCPEVGPVDVTRICQMLSHAQPHCH